FNARASARTVGRRLPGASSPAVTRRLMDAASALAERPSTCSASWAALTSTPAECTGTKRGHPAHPTGALADAYAVAAAETGLLGPAPTPEVPMNPNSGW